MLEGSFDKWIDTCSTTDVKLLCNYLRVTVPNTEGGPNKLAQLSLLNRTLQGVYNLSLALIGSL